MKNIEIYTDGACSGNPGPGGWGAIMKYGDVEKELSGGESETTNNRMELTAVIQGLEALKEKCNVTITTDSKYVVDGIVKGWAAGWRKNNWIKSDRKKALNSDLWDTLLNLIDRQNVTFNWVKGHNGHPFNERCDTLAVLETEKHKKS